MNKTTKIYLLSHLILCGLVGLSASLQAAAHDVQPIPYRSFFLTQSTQPIIHSEGESAEVNDITTEKKSTAQAARETTSPVSPSADHMDILTQPLKQTLPPDQLLIPANRQCLYTTIIMGYLLPVKEAANKVNARIDQLFGMQPAYYLNELHQTLENPTHYLTYLHSDTFSTLVTAFMVRTQIKKGTWGGPQEMQTIATKLKVNIQEYYPDPSNPTTLLPSNLTKPAKVNADITLHIVRDRVHPAELLTEEDKASAEDNPHYQHYRLKYTLLPSRQPLRPHKRGYEQKRNPYVVDWFKAAGIGKIKLLSALYHSYNINVNTSNNKGTTALLWSAQEGHLDCIKYLVEQGAHINTRNKWGSTALLLSAQEAHVTCVKYLVAQGAYLHDKNAYGNTPLIWSAYNGHIDCITYLLQQGANIHDKNKVGYTALLYSAREGHLACVKLLVQQGANIYDTNVYGHTALLLSAKVGHVDCVNFLLTSVDLRKLNLQGIDFSQATLPKDLSGLNLTDAKLPKDLTNHNLTQANLTGQRFTSTNFEGTQLEGVILTNTLCDYQQCFQDHVKVNKLNHGAWYLNNLPKDLTSIAQVYPHLSKDTHKAALLQIASGLAYLPYYEETEFYLKIQYWSCKLLLLKKQLSSELRAQLVCVLAASLEYDAKGYCWQTDYITTQVKEATEAPHDRFDQYLKTFQAGLQKYKCQSKEQVGYDWYKYNIEKNIQELQKNYPQLTDPKRQKEAIDIAFQLSTLYQHQHLPFLFRYLSLQNRLIQFKMSAGAGFENEGHYNSSHLMEWLRFCWSRKVEIKVHYNRPKTYPNPDR